MRNTKQIFWWKQYVCVTGVEITRILAYNLIAIGLIISQYYRVKKEKLNGLNKMCPLVFINRPTSFIISSNQYSVFAYSWGYLFFETKTRRKWKDLCILYTRRQWNDWRSTHNNDGAPRQHLSYYIPDLIGANHSGNTQRRREREAPCSGSFFSSVCFSHLSRDRIPEMNEVPLGTICIWTDNMYLISFWSSRKNNDRLALSIHFVFKFSNLHYIKQ